MSDGAARSDAVKVAGSGLRERNRAEVHARLVEAALALFAEQGFDGTTVDAITERAGVSRRTWFRYFPAKEDVVLARRVDQLTRFRALLAEAPADERAFDVVRRAFAALAAEYHALRRRILAERALFASAPSLLARDLEIDRAFEEAIADTMARGSAPGGARRARLCAAAVMGVLRVAIEEWAASRGRVDLAALGGEALDLIEPMAPHAPRARAARRRPA